MINAPNTKDLKPANNDQEFIFVLNFHCQGESIRVQTYQRTGAEQETLRRYEDFKISLPKINQYSNKIKDLLSRANRNGRITKQTLLSLKQSGQLLYEELLPPRTKIIVGDTKLESLILSIDDGLVQIPWELAYDGKEFLCQRFNMGRSVSTKQEFTSSFRQIHPPLQMLILADPQGNLPSSHQEGIELRNMLGEGKNFAATDFKSSGITKDYIRGRLRNYDILHYAGHAEYDSEQPANGGFLLADGKLSALEIRNMIGRTPFPSLVFCNACSSGRTEQWKIAEGYQSVHGLTNAFLVSGVRHYLGTFWEIPDEPSLHFALRFYDELAGGTAIGEAVKKARLNLIDAYGEESIFWGSYMLYGDPTSVYAGRKESAQHKHRPNVTQSQKQLGVLRGQLQENQPQENKPAEHACDVSTQNRSKNYFIPALIVVAAIASVCLLLQLLQRQGLRDNSSAKQLAPSQPSAAYQDSKPDRVDELIRQLAIKYEAAKNMRAEQGPLGYDSAQPLRMVFLGIQTHQVPERDSQFVVNAVGDRLARSGRVSLVERQILDKLLEELRLTTSDLADPATALKLGRILSAQVMVTGSMAREGGQWMVTLRFVETETTFIKATLSDLIRAKDIRELADILAKKVLDKIEVAYPVGKR